MTAPTPPTGGLCGCNDHQVDELRDLISRGFDQADVSRLLWGGDRLPVNRELLLEQVRRTTRRFVRTTLAAAIPWLRLPDMEDIG